MTEMMQAFWSSFAAFNVNGANSLIYILTDNIWYIIIMFCAILTVLLRLKVVTDYAVREEQNIL